MFWQITSVLSGFKKTVGIFAAESKEDMFYGNHGNHELEYFAQCYTRPWPVALDWFNFLPSIPCNYGFNTTLIDCLLNIIYKGLQRLEISNEN